MELKPFLGLVLGLVKVADGAEVVRIAVPNFGQQGIGGAEAFFRNSGWNSVVPACSRGAGRSAVGLAACGHVQADGPGSPFSFSGSASRT